MIDLWGVFRNLLWIAGLAVGLAALSVAEYQADEKVRLRQKLAEPASQWLLSFAVALVCLGLFLSSQIWWERAIFGLLALFFGAQTARLRRHARPAGAPTRHKEPSAARTAWRDSPSASWLGWGLVLAGLLVMGGWNAIAGIRAIEHTRSLQSHFQYLERLAVGGADRLGPADLESAGQHLSGLREDLEAIQTHVGPWLRAGWLLRWVPAHGGDLAAASDLLNLATRLSSAGDRTFQALSPALELTVGEWEEPASALSVGERLLPVLEAAQPELRAARQEIAAARQARDPIDAQSLSPQVAGYLQRLDQILPWFETALGGALLAPGLLGGALPSAVPEGTGGHSTLGGPRTYLILAQNNHELRPTGGFISGVGELTIERGRLTSLSFSDSYAVDNFEVPHEFAPPDMQQTLFSELWFFRDTNWDADFPTSAQRALDVYARDRGVQADGVIALDLTALELVVGALGPMQVPGIREPVTGDNVQQIIQARWAEPKPGLSPEQSGDWWLHRKDAVGQIASAAINLIGTGRDVPLAELGKALTQALGQKHILVYLTDPQAAGLLRETGWGGALPDPSISSDTLLVVDSNVGFNKVDPNVSRSLKYEVDLASEGGARARVTVEYHNHSVRPVQACVQEARYGGTYSDMMDRCYWDYVRVYVPSGSRLLEAPDLDLPSGSLLARNRQTASRLPISPAFTEGDRDVWAAFFDVAPGAKRTLAFEYQLPQWVIDRDAEGVLHYRLLLQKQPGTEAVPLRLEIALPSGAELLDATPTVLLPAQGTVIVVSTDLRTDREFEVAFRLEGMRP
jgi:hypothetical protein